MWSCAKDSLGDVIAKWDHGDTGLTSCTFLSTGKEVVVANQDGLVKVFITCTCIVDLPYSTS